MAEIPLPDNRISLRALQVLVQQRSLLAALDVFHTELGDIFQIPLPGFNPIMLVGEEANHFILVEQRDHLRWRSERDPVTNLLQHGVLVEDGESHDHLRRLMNPALHRRMLERYVDTMQVCTDSVIQDWHTATSPLDMLVETRKIALLILAKTLFGVELEPELKRLWQPILRTLRYISPGLWVIWRDVPRPGYQRAIQQLKGYLHDIIRRRRNTAGNDLLGLLIASSLPDDLITDQLLTMIIAGHDTSTALLSWALYLLAGHSHVQATARQEMDSVFSTLPPDYTRFGELHYLEQIIQETLRLYPPIHLGSRVASCDLDFQGYTIPAGRRVLYSIYLTHHDRRYWSSPEAFMPERFAPDAAQPRSPYTFLPFGGGPRNCIGMMFAQVEAKIVLARILQEFELDFAGHAVRVSMGATLEPRPGVRVRVRKRA